jgi:hypothetical protein
MKEVQKKIEKLKRELSKEEVKEIEQEHKRSVSKSHRGASDQRRQQSNLKIVT